MILSRLKVATAYVLYLPKRFASYLTHAYMPLD